MVQAICLVVMVFAGVALARVLPGALRTHQSSRFICAVSCFVLLLIPFAVTVSLQPRTRRPAVRMGQDVQPR